MHSHDVTPAVVLYSVTFISKCTVSVMGGNSIWQSAHHLVNRNT